MDEITECGIDYSDMKACLGIGQVATVVTQRVLCFDIDALV